MRTLRPPRTACFPTAGASGGATTTAGSAARGNLASPARPCASIGVCADPDTLTVTSSPVASASSPCATSAVTSTDPVSWPPWIASFSSRCGENQPSLTASTVTTPFTLAPTSRSTMPRT